ncbi:MAG TPA: SRPBCC family protein [Candidatus Solibacter sp.]|jgi:hypothetical protein|nr:SRPBCC family protein [Candidatus Solibacter sp.]
MIRSTRTDHVEQHPDEFFAALFGSPDHMLAWHPHFVAMAPLTPGPMGPGARYRVTSTKIGELVVEVSDYVPGVHYKAGGSTSLGRMDHEYRLSPEGSGTRIEQTAYFSAQGWRVLLAPLHLLIARKSVGLQVAAYRSYLGSDAGLAALAGER